MAKSKLYRNLKPGDKFRVESAYKIGLYRSHIVTVSAVHETCRGYFSGKRQWEVSGDYPYWWNGPIRAYSDDRTDLVTL